MIALLRLLQDGRFHSGEELGTFLGVTRAAVWKQLKRFEDEFNLSLHRVRGKGYCLATPLSLLDDGHFEHFRQKMSWPFFVRGTLDSTSAEALRLLERGVSAPFVVLAEQQVAGRGRRGRAWVSPYGQNIYFSLAWPVTGGAKQLEGLSLVVGLAVRHALESIGVVKAGLKWPNDVLVEDRKISGILLELNGAPADLCHVLIGVGINANMSGDAGQISQPWTSVYRETGQIVDRNHLVRVLAESLALYLSRHENVGFSGLRKEWEASHLWQNRRVKLFSGLDTVEGSVLGVSDQGALVLEVEGQRRLYSGGELSLRLQNDS